jgi:2,4-dienoyl-CoA reductase-like NADH-dependent reductase (Old Yellow Enzyme family)
MKLFEPLSLGPVTLASRVVLPAMVTRLSGEDGHVNQDILSRYARFAVGEPGLIVVEAMGISQAKSGPLLRISDDQFLPGLERLAACVHKTAGVRVVPQIIHFLKIARSGWRQTIADLTVPEIAEIIRQFAAAAVRARVAGFDGVELHMAHAYTMSSFLSRKNRRKDEYGGSLANRLRAPTQALLAVRQAVGRDFLVGVRFDGEECITDGYSLHDAQRIAVQLGRSGADYVSISAGGKFEDAIHKPGQPLYPYTGYSGDRCMPGKAYPDGFNLYLAAGIRQALQAHGLAQVRVIGSGKIWDPDHAERIVAEQVDLVGMARQLLADPDWPRKVKSGRRDTIVWCEYGNVCKALDENFQKVRCTLWPKEALHAPESLLPAAAPPPRWPEGGAGLVAELGRGRVRLSWQRALAAAPRPGSAGDPAELYGYELLRGEGERRAAELGHYASVRAATPAFLDSDILSGQTYTYAVQAYDRRGVRGPLSEPLTLRLPEVAVD